MKCKITFFSILLIFTCLSPCMAAPMNLLQSEELDTSGYEISYSTERAQLWVEKNYMSDEEIAQLGALVDEGIKKAEDYLGTSFEKEYGYKGKITYYIKSGHFISHVYGAYYQNRYLKNGRTLVPLRAIFEALGAEVFWNGETQTVTAKKGDTEIQLVIGGEAYKNGQLIPLDVPAKSFNGRTLVPLRFVSEALGCQTGWNSETQTITINRLQ